VTSQKLRKAALQQEHRILPRIAKQNSDVRPGRYVRKHVARKAGTNISLLCLLLRKAMLLVGHRNLPRREPSGGLHQEAIFYVQQTHACLAAVRATRVWLGSESPTNLFSHTRAKRQP